MLQQIGPVMLDVVGKELTAEERELLQHPLVGGVILFARNYESPQQMTELCQALRQARSLPLLIAVDQEGGRVQRFQRDFTRLPSMGKIGQLHASDPVRALACAELCGWLMAAELQGVGVDLSFAPVLDLNKESNPAIGDRAFHKEPMSVIPLATALIRGMQQMGMRATGKHFPGHGSVTVDSHVGTPVDMRSMEEIVADDLQPFIELIRSGIHAIMAAHIIFPKVDAKPVGFSSHWLQTVLRHRYQFSGMIFSDDLNMKGADVVGDYATRAAQAFDAGCEMALICNNRAGAIHILDNLSQRYFVDHGKFKLLQGKFSISFEELKKTALWKTKHEALLHLTEHL